ncbi:MAG TPA: LytR C-terminal domain-containing protein, partial [Actinomycetota bacterium]|nr:LytR C-terminal domain-containing protein [Actinomycetota bacterium]
SGLAASAADELQQYGYEISGVGNAQRNYRVTTLFYQPDAQAAAEQLAADFFPEARLEAANNNLSPNIQVTVVIGEDAL